MRDEAMTDARLLELIAAYGANPMDYPEGESDEARAILTDTPQRFAAALAEAAETDALLATLPDADPSPALMAALVSAAPHAHAVKRNWFAAILRPIRIVPAAGALASLAIGAVIGTSIAAPASVAAFEDEAVVYASLGLTDYDVYDEVSR